MFPASLALVIGVQVSSPSSMNLHRGLGTSLINRSLPPGGCDMKEGSICASWIGFRSVVIVPTLAVAAWVVWAQTAVREAMAVEEPRIEITIKDFTYKHTKMQPIRAGVPMAFVVHNEDSVRHGFISPLFQGRSVRGEGEGVEAFGTGIEGFHIDPGKTLVIRVTPDRQGKITFRCDLHPDVKGELYLLDVPVG